MPRNFNRADLHQALREMGPYSTLFPSDGLRLAYEHFAQRWTNRPNRRDLEIAGALWEILEQCSPTDADNAENLAHQIDIWIRG